MRKRPGGTVKISVSLPKETVAALRSRAKRVHDGNLSAVIGELAEDARLLDGMDALIEELGGPSLTDEARARIERELAAPLPTPGSRTRKARRR